MASNTGSAVVSNQTFTTGVVPITVGVLNPANSPQNVWDCGVGMNYASMTTSVTGSPASFTILLEGTYDGSNWFQLASTSVTGGETTYSSGALPFTNLRARCTAVSGGASPTVNVFVTASQSAMVSTSAGTNPSQNVAQGAGSGSNPGWIVSPGAVNPTTTLNAVTTGNGTTVDFGAAKNAVMFQIVPTGTVTAGQVQMQLSMDNVTWSVPPTASFTNYSAATLANPYVLVTSTNALFGVANIAARYARAIVSTNVTGGATVTVQVAGY